MTNIEYYENIVSIKFMNEQVMSIGNEYAEEEWLLVYPDGADADDIKAMASDEEQMQWLRESYQFIMEHYQ